MPEDAMHSDRMPPDAVGRLVIDAEVSRLEIRMEQTERLMCEALRRGAYTRAARYRLLCEAAVAACMDLME